MKKRILLPNEQDYYVGNLPHWQPENAVLFMTTRLAGSLPKDRIQELKERRADEENLLRNQGLSELEMKKELRKIYDLYFGKFDALLDGSTTGPHWLKEDSVAKIWKDSLSHFDTKRYKVICSTVMSNHTHFIFYKLTQSLSRIMKSIKGFSAREINKVLERTGEYVWQHESFDRMVRDREELRYRINYVLNNAVEAGIVEHWTNYKHNYIHPDFLKFVDV